MVPFLAVVFALGLVFYLVGELFSGLGAVTGAPLPASAPPSVPWSALPLMVAAFLAGAVGEELGWSGFAAEAMLRRHGVVVVGLALGAAWALWHVVPYGQLGHGAAWIAGQCVFTVAFRVVLVQLYVAAGRCLVVPVLAHVGHDLAWALFPAAGSFHDPALAAVITAAAAGVLALTGAGRRRDLGPAGGSPEVPA